MIAFLKKKQETSEFHIILMDFLELSISHIPCFKPSAKMNIFKLKLY